MVGITVTFNELKLSLGGRSVSCRVGPLGVVPQGAPRPEKRLPIREDEDSALTVSKLRGGADGAAPQCLGGPSGLNPGDRKSA